MHDIFKELPHEPSSVRGLPATFYYHLPGNAKTDTVHAPDTTEGFSKFRIAATEKLSVIWPSDCKIEKFGGEHEETRWQNLCDQATAEGLHLTFRGRKRLRQGESETAEGQTMSEKGIIPFVTILGPDGKTLEWYRILRNLMASKRQAKYKGLPHPDKIILLEPADDNIHWKPRDREGHNVEWRLGGTTDDQFSEDEMSDEDCNHTVSPRRLDPPGSEVHVDDTPMQTFLAGDEATHSDLQPEPASIPRGVICSGFVDLYETACRLLEADAWTIVLDAILYTHCTSDRMGLGQALSRIA